MRRRLRPLVTLNPNPNPKQTICTYNGEVFCHHYYLESTSSDGPSVQGEVFCHRYYLKHLTDERYAAWPLADHVQLLQVSEHHRGAIGLLWWLWAPGKRPGHCCM